MTASKMNNVILSQTSIGGSGDDLGFTNPITVTIATTDDEENLTKDIKVLGFPTTTNQKDTDTTSDDYGAKVSKILDLLKQVEQRITIDGYLVNDMGVNTTSITSSGASTINVESTREFSSSGTLYIAGDAFTYTGKTDTSLTGVSGVSGDKAKGSVVSPDTNNSAEDKKEDLKKLFLGGGVINMSYEGDVFTVNIDKLSIKRERFDGLTGDDGVGEFSVKFTCIKGVNLGG